MSRYLVTAAHAVTGFLGFHRRSLYVWNSPSGAKVRHAACFRCGVAMSLREGK